MNRAIEWFARNSVAANLMMFMIFAGGALSISSIRLEVFPEFDLDMISVEVPYLGAAPEEVEQAVSIRIEEAIQGIDGIQKVTSTASEGRGTVQIELELGADTRRVVDEVKSSVDAIDTFPDETEQPIVRELTSRGQVIDLAVSGNADELTLKLLAEQVRDDLSAIPEITQVEVTNARPYEIAIEVSEGTLRRHGLTFDQVADAVRRSSLDLPGGSVKSEGGEILLRTIGQAYRGDDYERLVLWTRADGSRILLGDVAEVVDGFAETDQFGRFDGEPAVRLSVYSAGNESVIEIAEHVRAYVEDAQARLPEGVSLTVWQDQSRVLADRLRLLLRNGATGFALVFLVLALFIQFRLAFWVSLGIPISFLGALWMLPGLDVTLNMITLFAFILVLGIVVDDAIVVGENVYTHQRRHGDSLTGAIEGAREIAVPVVFAVLTTVAAFSPLLAVPGTMGKMMRAIPLIVIPCLLFSLIESLWILPAHLSHLKPPPERPGLWLRFQSRVAGSLQWFIRRVYQPTLDLGLRWRYVSFALGVATLMITIGMVGAGMVPFQFFPAVEAEVMSATLTMPQGTPATVTTAAVQQLEAGAERLRAEMREVGQGELYQHLYSAVGEQPQSGAGPVPLGNAGGGSGSHLGEVTIELLPSEDRNVGSDDLAERWRDLTGAIPEAVEVSFGASLFGGGADIDVQLTGPDVNELRSVADDLKVRLADYSGVYEISDSFREGKAELALGITPAAETLGLSLRDLARQVRQAFYGEEAQRIQRGRDDVRVMVRYPRDERGSIGDLENMRIRTPAGVEVPFGQVALVTEGRGYASITRVDRQRAVNVTATVDSDVVAAGDVIGDLDSRVLPELLAGHPGVRFTFEGMQSQQREAIGGLQSGFTLALFAIFALLAIPLRSYVQPVIIMLAIPFGLVGGFWGHILTGNILSIMSMFGMVALTGVVVNDSLVMVHFINRRRLEHVDLKDAVHEAGTARFRPIVLTSLTTFAGLAPLMLERSMQAQFLIPMAVSLAFGVVFATVVTLVLVPVCYMMLDDVRGIPVAVARLFADVEPDDARGTEVPHGASVGSGGMGRAMRRSHPGGISTEGTGSFSGR
ncbi:MAG: efflux RND transporter permease subunit [Acidobacteria bacterium]|nr:efflux RND transporter permease subunit [Acidobacteriota bacterium]